MKFFVFGIRENHHRDKNQNKEDGKNQLSRAEHICLFLAKLMQTKRNEKKDSGR